MFEFEYIITWCAYDVPWYHHNYTLAYNSTTLTMTYGSAPMDVRLIFKRTTMAMTHYSVRMSIENIYCVYIIERYRVGFGRTESTCWCMTHWSRGCTDVDFDWIRIHILCIWNGIVLALDEQGVRWYWCIFEFECVITWCIKRHDTITITHFLVIQLQWQWHSALCWLTLACYSNTQQRRWHTTLH